jgi:hypothetical protein
MKDLLNKNCKTLKKAFEDGKWMDRSNIMKMNH